MMSQRTVTGLLLLAFAGFASADIPPHVLAADSGVMGALAPTIEARLPRWVATWKAASPDFTPTRFQMSLLKNIAEAWAESYDRSEMHEALRSRLYVVSPDGTRAIHPYATLSFWTRDGQTKMGIPPESAVMLIDLIARRTMWLGQCDLGCGFHEAVWLANDRAMVAGYELDFDDTNCPNNGLCRSIPDLLLYDFSRHTVMLFKGPSVPGGPRQEYAVRRIRERLPEVPFY
jgi:hypothetical protein